MPPAATAPKTTRRPNIVYIMADDMGYGDLGCYGATKIPTPNMDRVAAEGVRFTDAHSASAVCTPSRYAVLTGRYCWRSRLKKGVEGGFSLPLIDPARTTIARMLQDSGYATAAVGKWHVGLEFQAKDGERIDTNNWADEGHVDYTKPILGGPTTLGFDYFFGIAGSLDMPPYCHIENDHTYGVPTEPKDPLNAQQRTGWCTPGWRDEDVDVHHAHKAVEWLERMQADDPDKPFFLYLTPSAPHRPCLAPAFAVDRSEAGPRGDLVCVVDWMVGEVLDTLDRLGVADETLLIVTSDNGARPYDTDKQTYGHKSCGELRGFKSHIWDGGHREPFIARWPGEIKPGSTCDQRICLMDLMATVAEIVGAELPERAAEDSFSFLPALRGEAHQRPAMVHHSIDGSFALREGKWKAIFCRNHGGFPNEPELYGGDQDDDCPGQLYDMEKDWRETTNLWDRRPEIVEQLRERLRDIVESGRSRPAHER